MKKLLSSLLALCLALSLTLPAASALELDEAKELLKELYVDGVSDEVLALDSLDAILEAIGDPYTFYMTAEQYDAFNQSVNGQVVVGIGATVETAFDNGYRIMSVLPNSPALEAGIQPGDVLVAVDGVELTAETDPRVPIVGEEGTGLTVTVLRNGQRLNFSLVRRSVQIPIVTYALEGGAGYIDCISFGATTPYQVQEAIQQLDSSAAVWVVDLRSNPGGGSDSTALTSSLFTGGGIMLYFRDGGGNYQYTYTSYDFPALTDKPVIVLLSEHSASGSELFAGDIRSYGAGIALGQRSFGKGTAQLVLEESNCEYMENGEAMKITAYRFFAPDGATNHIVGVLPTLLLSPENTERAAMLLTSPAPNRTAGYLRLDVAEYQFYIRLSDALQEENRAAFTELLEALPPDCGLYQGSSSNRWTQVEPAALAKANGLDFTSRTLPDTAASEYSWEIDTLTAYGILTGYADGNFHPTDQVTRAQFCTMVASALDLTASAGKGGRFSDVPAGSWFEGPVSAMADMGFISGYGDGRFGPGDPVSYQEMVTILNRVAAWVSMDGYDLNHQSIQLQDAVTFKDFADWAQIPARNLNALGSLLDGYAPSDLSTREMAAAMLCRLMVNTNLIWK